MHEKLNLRQKLDLFDVHWQPKIVGRFNDNDLRVVKVKGEFVWHKHEHTNPPRPLAQSPCRVSGRPHQHLRRRGKSLALQRQRGSG